jgi:Holliday junction DNA helicase RuvA
MFYYLSGVITHIEPNLAVVDCGGVGYACLTTANTLSYLTVNEKSKLYTYCYIKEDAFDIYGFHTESEKRSFEMLLGVSGVGPKAALSILSANTPESFAASVITNNEKALTSAQGIGKKLAQRIILELKDKLSKNMTDFKYPVGAPVLNGGSLSKATDAASALAVLGYSQSEISYVLNGVDMEQPLEDIIRQALKKTLK